MSEEREIVFVCGRLRPGAELSGLLPGKDLLGAATVGGKLFEISGTPGLVLLPSASEVKGELFQVSEERLAELDALVGEEFERVRATASSEKEQREVWVWAYQGDFRSKKEIIPPDWLFHVRPRRAPLFVILAALPVLVLIGGALRETDRGMQEYLAMVLYEQKDYLFIGSIIMALTGVAALWRRERAEEVAVMAFLMGVVGVVASLFPL